MELQSQFQQNAVNGQQNHEWFMLRSHTWEGRGGVGREGGMDRRVGQEGEGGGTEGGSKGGGGYKGRIMNTSTMEVCLFSLQDALELQTRLL